MIKRFVTRNPEKWGFANVHAFGLDLKDVSLCHYRMRQHRRQIGFHGHEHRTDTRLRIDPRDHGNRPYAHVNVCVENWDYTPQDMNHLISEVKNIMNVTEPFKKSEDGTHVIVPASAFSNLISPL